MTALILPSEVSTLHVGANVIVRQGDQSCSNPCVDIGESCEDCEFAVPQDWVALTGPCPTCDGEGIVGINLEPPDQGIHWCDNRDCRDGRRIVPLYTECWCTASDYKSPDSLHNNPTGRYHCEDGRVLVGRGSIEVVPVVRACLGGPGRVLCVFDSSPRCVGLIDFTKGPPHPVTGPFRLDPLPVPGRDWGIVIDCVEIAT